MSYIFTTLEIVIMLFSLFKLVASGTGYPRLTASEMKKQQPSLSWTVLGLPLAYILMCIFLVFCLFTVSDVEVVQKSKVSLYGFLAFSFSLISVPRGLISLLFGVYMVRFGRYRYYYIVGEAARELSVYDLLYGIIATIISFLLILLENS